MIVQCVKLQTTSVHQCIIITINIVCYKKLILLF